jgi:hypothetical protein
LLAEKLVSLHVSGVRSDHLACETFPILLIGSALHRLHS